MSGPTDIEWTTRVAELLSLAEHGTMILADRAHDSHVGDLVRRLVRDWPDVDYVMSATELQESKPGSTLILDVDDDDEEFAALNIVRPVLREKGLRVVIWAREGISAKLAHRAPDFFDWISHRVEAPPRCNRGAFQLLVSLA